MVPVEAEFPILLETGTFLGLFLFTAERLFNFFFIKESFFTLLLLSYYSFIKFICYSLL
jgi:hypothetical protein